MARRPRPSLADYAVIGISPALIMFLIGSLVFFLIAVFYQGQFDVRLSFIMAMFIMAAVSIARISIDQGREYAALFALPLAGVTLFAMFRFVEFSGALARLSSVLNVGLIAMIWYCADKLTWDCTVIDENKDQSGQGLLQTAGMGDDHAGEETEAATEDPAEPPAPVATGLWQKFVEHRRRPHAPGIWVIYFSVAALPVFGFGQLFLRDSISRRYAFKLLVVFVASALGLLLTTSFLGLRRYLRQRRLEMPPEMAGTWLGVGGAMIVALLLLCMLMPRRNAEYSVSDLAFLNSPIDLPVSDWAVGNDGQEQESADRKVSREDATERMEGQKGEGGQTASKQAKGDNDPSQGKSSSGADSSSESKDGKKKSGGDASQGSKSNQPDANPSQQERSEGQPQGKEPQGTKSQGEPQGEQQGKQGGQQQDDAEQNVQGQGEQKQGEQESADRSRQQEQARQAERERSAAQQQGRQQRAQQQAQQEKSSAASKSRTNPGKMPSRFSPTLGGILKALYWLIAIAVIGYVVWKYWEHILPAIQNFIQALKDFWARLFGGELPDASQDAAAIAAPAPNWRPFADFPDPFLTGRADRMSTEELIGYTFDAFQAWGREQGCGRLAEQTPIEFAKAAARSHHELRKEGLQVAELYNWTAYGKTAVPAANREILRRFWQTLSPSVVA